MTARDDIGRRLVAAAEAMNALIADCHEKVACPKCHAPIGQRCRRARRAFVTRGIYATGQPVLKHPHRERWTLVVPDR